MAGVTCEPVGVIRGNNLGEGFRLGAIRLMAADAEHRCIQLRRGQRCRIRGMLPQRPVAGFAVHMDVSAVLLLRDHVTVAILTRLVASVIYRATGNLRDRIRAIMAVLSEASRNKKTTNHQEDNDSRRENCCKPEQMTGILE